MPREPANRRSRRRQKMAAARTKNRLVSRPAAAAADRRSPSAPSETVSTRSPLAAPSPGYVSGPGRRIARRGRPRRRSTGVLSYAVFYRWRSTTPAPSRTTRPTEPTPVSLACMPATHRHTPSLTASYAFVSRPTAYVAALRPSGRPAGRPARGTANATHHPTNSVV